MKQKPAWHQRLPARALFFLTFALVPLGIIGVVQNAELFKASERRSELSLLALTEQAASGERQIIERAFGAADALGAIIDTHLDDPEECSAYLQRYLDSSSLFVFVGFLPVSGLSECSTAGKPLDFSNYPDFADYIENPRPNIEINLAGAASGSSVMIVNQPRFKEGALQGYVSISLPLKDVGATEDFLGDPNPITLVTFNERGDLLSAENGREIAQDKIPADIPLHTLAKGEPRTFVAKNRLGAERVYGVIPIVPDVVYALSSWRVDGPFTSAFDVPRFSIALPFLMWLASLFVAWFVINRLVIKRISSLATAIESFAKDRTLPQLDEGTAISAELGMLESSFVSMAEDLLHDEAQLEERVREKSILLKEVHHRVKNNLQIISSIMNMQIRKASVPETKRALAQVQDRIMGLSGVHRTLYQATNLTEINAAHLIEHIVEQSKAIGGVDGTDLNIKTDLDPVVIFPDQAVPLSMLVAEALTNAMKYLGAMEDSTPELSISLSLEDGDYAHLSISNTRGSASMTEEDAQASGLGRQLIRAFATQVNGRLEIIDEADRYEVHVRFKVEQFQNEALDY